MKEKATIIKGGKYVQLENGDNLPLSKHNKNLGLIEGQEVFVSIDNEYPESCDNNPFCEGDETCIICLCNNKVAII